MYDGGDQQVRTKTILVGDSTRSCRGIQRTGAHHWRIVLAVSSISALDIGLSFSQRRATRQYVAYHRSSRPRFGAPKAISDINLVHGCAGKICASRLPCRRITGLKTPHLKPANQQFMEFRVVNITAMETADIRRPPRYPRDSPY